MLIRANGSPFRLPNDTAVQQSVREGAERPTHPPRLQGRVGNREGTAGVDPLQVSGHILYTFEDAMEADECPDGAGEVCTRARVWRVDDERVVRAPRRGATDGLQGGPTARSRRRRWAGGAP